MKTFIVTMRKQFPPWDERDGIASEHVADSKAKAIRYARHQMDKEGHSGTGFGRITFKATEIDPQTR